MAVPTRNILSLCAGYGGLDLGLRLVDPAARAGTHGSSDYGFQGCGVNPKMNSRILVGDNLRSLRRLALEGVQVDSVVTDPPYGLSFMGKKWDYDVPTVEFWRLVYTVLKPGGYVLSFGGTRTYHRMACALEDAGFELRDMLSWLYGSGFPKSKNVGGGFGTALKPACEPIALARKPLDGKTVASNVLAFRTGALNIDGCRIESEKQTGWGGQTWNGSNCGLAKTLRRAFE